MTRRVTAITIASLALFLPVAWSLLTRVPSESVQPLAGASRTAGAPAELSELSYLRTSEEARVYRVSLATKHPSELARHAELQLLVATYDTVPSLERGDLYFDGTDCVFKTVPAARFVNNDYVTFEQGSGCEPLSGTPSGTVRLTLRFTSGGRVALWTSTQPDSTDAGDDLEIAHRPIRGLAVDIVRGDTARRADLLAHVWEISGTSRWIWTTLGVSSLLLACAVGLIPGVSGDTTARSLVIVRTAGAMFCASAGLALLYAVLVPPFQTADEPNHFLGFAAFIGRVGTYEEASLWARRSHFERIQFHGDQHFTPADARVLGKPWDGGGAPDAETRGLAITWLWSAVAPIVGHQPLQHMLLSLRLIDVLLFAMANAAFGALVGAYTRIRHAELLAIPLFLVPTLPFFGMTVSNYAPLLGAYIVLGAGVLIHLLGNKHEDAAGVVVGTAFALALLISRSALPLAPLVAAILASRMIVGGQPAGLRSAAVFWIGFAASMTAGSLLADPSYVRRLGESVLRSFGTGHPLAAGELKRLRFLAGPVFLLGLPVEWGLARFIRRIHTVRWTSIILSLLRIEAFVVGAMILLSPFVQYPTLSPMNIAATPPPLVYAGRVLAAGLTFFRVARHDFATSTSFWGGFGWLDTQPPVLLISALSMTTGVAFIATLWRLAQLRAWREAIVLQWIVAGSAASLAAYGFSVVATTPGDVHGRYLLGLYVSLLLTIWSGIALIADACPPRAVAIIRVVCALGCLSVHLVCFQTLLSRYF